MVVLNYNLMIFTVYEQSQMFDNLSNVYLFIARLFLFLMTVYEFGFTNTFMIDEI